MILKLNDENLEKYENFKGGEKYLNAMMFVDDLNRIIYGELPVAGSIGMHTHDINSEIIHLLHGNAKVIFDGKEERISAGDTHYCPKGHTHSLINDSDETIKFFAVVPNQ